MIDLALVPRAVTRLLTLFHDVLQYYSFIEQFLHGGKILEHHFRLVVLSPNEPDPWCVCTNMVRCDVLRLIENAWAGTVLSVVRV